MQATNSLEIVVRPALRRPAADSGAPLGLTVDLRFDDPDSVTGVAFTHGRAELDAAALLAVRHDPDAYGRALTVSLFGAGGPLRDAWRDAVAATERDGKTLRIRLVADPAAPELHALVWETLRHPLTDAPLATGERVLFFRHLPSRGAERVELGRLGELRVVACIASPRDPDGRWNLPSIDAPAERARIDAVLGDLERRWIVREGGGGTPATLDALVDAMRDGVDVVYLAAHGVRPADGGEPAVFLERADGTVDRVGAGDLAARVAALEHRPRLVVLASCLSAGAAPAGSGEALAALGPRLVEAGVPGVVAMQGEVRFETVDAFMPAFFRELRRDGAIDRAVAAARSATLRPAVPGTSQWWMPLLFLRARGGSLWYRPGYTGGASGTWDAVVEQIAEGLAVPIVGPGLAEPLFGARADAAADLADRFGFPLEGHAREALPRVAQYLEVAQARRFLVRRFEQVIGDALARAVHPGGSPAAAAPADPPAAATRPVRADPPAAGRDPTDAVLALLDTEHGRRLLEPYAILASLPCPVFVTTDPSPLLAAALTRAGKRPRVDFCRWNARLDRLPSPLESAAGYFDPTVDEPLVYHMFGTLEHDASLVLTEDDYFDCLAAAMGRRDKRSSPQVGPADPAAPALGGSDARDRPSPGGVPPQVQARINEGGLLFLGFRVDEWDFRVLYRCLMREEAWAPHRDFKHVAAQILPEEGRYLDPEGARRYFEKYFGEDRISIYWGSPREFVADLRDQVARGGSA